VTDAVAHDFTLSKGSEAIDKGVKVFVPWSLYGVVGEWNFCRNNKSPEKILDDHWYMNSYFGNRDEYRFTPTFPLTGKNIDRDSYIKGPLENWSSGALTLNGKNTYAVLKESEMKSYSFLSNGKNITVSGSELKRPQMDTNNFLIECYLKTNKVSKYGKIMSKMDSKVGWAFGLDGTGKPVVKLKLNGKYFAQRISTKAINDAKWHHLIAEVDRNVSKGIKIYIDGVDCSGKFTGTMNKATLANESDLLIAGGPKMRYLSGAIDFLRISRGTLADAKTTIRELYDWEFNGPQLHDFKGNDVTGATRDAGAFEYK